GLVEQAAREHAVDLQRSYVVGDKASDILMAKRLGLRSILVLTGRGGEGLEGLRAEGVLPDSVAEDLYEAACWIINQPSAISSQRSAGSGKVC
ncbi:MAG: HAD hydrolase-like protein, partial [Candidatus Methylomirabilales bacterium]